MTVKYFRRRDKFEAIKFSKDNYEEARDFTRGRLYYNSVSELCVLYTAAESFPIREGDYIAEDGGDFTVWSEDVFESLYEEV